jgi:hypothetical protein
MSDYFYEDERVLEWLELVEPRATTSQPVADADIITSVASLLRSHNISDDAQSAMTAFQSVSSGSIHRQRESAPNTVTISFVQKDTMFARQ